MTSTVFDRLIDAINNHDIDAMTACFATDFVNVWPAHPGRGFTGRDQVRRNWSAVFAARPDTRASVRERVHHGDEIWAEWEVVGTEHDGTIDRSRGVIVVVASADVITEARFYMEPVDHGARRLGEITSSKEHPSLPQAPAVVRGMFSLLGRTAPGPAAALAARAFLHVGRPAPVRTADRRVHEAARRGLLPYETADVVTYAWGAPDAPAVLLVHGWQSRASAFGSLVTALTGAGLRAVAYDAPAHGDSSGRTRTALDDVAIIRRLTDVEPEPWAGVVGHSLGSLTAGVAVRDGVPTERLVGVASIASFRFTEDVFVRAIGLPWTLRDRFSQAWAHRFRDVPEVTPDVADRFDLVTHPLSSKVRALWLHDDGDQQIPQTQSELLLEAHPHSGELVTTTGLGHNRILGDAEVIAHVVDHLTFPADNSRPVQGEAPDWGSAGFRSP